MAEKNYPLIIQTWLKGRGSSILNGCCDDNNALRWAKQEVLRWNELRRPQEGEEYTQGKKYQNYRLFGIIRYGGVEDFGRPFTEIVAVLCDDRVPVETELRPILADFKIPKNSEPEAFMVSLEVNDVEPEPVSAEPRQPMPVRPQRSGSLWSIFLVVAVLLLAGVGVLVAKKIMLPEQDCGSQPETKTIPKAPMAKPPETITPATQTTATDPVQPDSSSPQWVQVVWRVNPPGAVSGILVNDQSVKDRDKDRIPPGKYHVKVFANTGYKLAKITITDAKKAETSETLTNSQIWSNTLMFRRDTTIDLQLNPISYQLTFAVEPPGKGNIKDQDTEVVKPKSYPYKSTIQLQAEPIDKLWHFSQWKGVSKPSDKPQLDLVVEGNATITACFQKKQTLIDFEEQLRQWRDQRDPDSSNGCTNFIRIGENLKQQDMSLKSEQFKNADDERLHTAYKQKYRLQWREDFTDKRYTLTELKERCRVWKDLRTKGILKPTNTTYWADCTVAVPLVNHFNTDVRINTNEVTELMRRFAEPQSLPKLFPADVKDFKVIWAKGKGTSIQFMLDIFRLLDMPSIQAKYSFSIEVTDINFELLLNWNDEKIEIGGFRQAKLSMGTIKIHIEQGGYPEFCIGSE